jgi:hypothetical protein
METGTNLTSPTGLRLPQRLRGLAIDAAAMAYGEKATAKSADISAARDAIGPFRAAMQGVTDRQLRAVLIGMADVVVKPDALRGTDRDRLDNFFGSYLDVLRHVPPAVLTGAVRSWIRGTNRFFPTPGELLAECRLDESWREDVSVLKGLQRLCAARPDEPFVPPTDEQLAEISARLEAMRARHRTQDREAAMEADSDGQRALDWYKKPRDWKNAPRYARG